MKNSVWMAAVVLFGASAGWSETGTAKLQGTAEGSTITGTVTLTDTKEGLKVTAQLAGVPAGQHGFHIHVFGSCENAGKAAGDHYNPKKAAHGHVAKDGIKKAHGGDMGNITAQADGTATLEVLIPKVTLTDGKFTVGGRAIILHEKADDFSQPAGNAGGRIACGVISVTAK